MERVQLPLTMMDEYMEIAIRNDNAKLLRELLAEKPERLEERNKYGETPLIMAVYTPRRSLGVIGTLLDAGADVNGRNRAGFTALHVVIWNEYFPPESASSEEIIALLLDAGAALEDDQNNYGATALALAVFEGCSGDARILLERGASANFIVCERTAQTGDGGLGLLCFAWLKPEMMQILLEGGAEVNLRNSCGQTASEWIEEQDAGEFEAQKRKSLGLLRRAQ